MKQKFPLHMKLFDLRLDGEVSETKDVEYYEQENVTAETNSWLAQYLKMPRKKERFERMKSYCESGYKDVWSGKIIKHGWGETIEEARRELFDMLFADLEDDLRLQKVEAISDEFLELKVATKN